jgi:hypothetical protein
MKKAVYLLAAMALISSDLQAIPRGDRIHRKQNRIAGSYLVSLDWRLAGDLRASAKALVQKNGGELGSIWDGAVHGFNLKATEAQAAAISTDPMVLNIEEDETLVPTQSPCGQHTSRCADGKLPWQLDRIDQYSLPLDGAYVHTTGQGRGAMIFHIDSGVLASHSEFLDDRYRTRVLQGADFVHDGNGTTDCYSHGTYTASLAIGRTAGVAREANLVPVRVFDCNGKTTVARVMDAIHWVRDTFHSYGGLPLVFVELSGADSYELKTAVNELGAAGMIVVLAAGNNGGNACNYSPANAGGRGTVVVGASTSSDHPASYSNQGSCVTLFAPGDGVGGDAYSYDGLNCNPGWGGTSSAIGVATGIFAMFWANHIQLTSTQAINEVMKYSAIGQMKGLAANTQNLLILNPYDPWISCDYSPPVR